MVGGRRSRSGKSLSFPTKVMDGSRNIKTRGSIGRPWNKHAGGRLRSLYVPDTHQSINEPWVGRGSSRAEPNSVMDFVISGFRSCLTHSSAKLNGGKLTRLYESIMMCQM